MEERVMKLLFQPLLENSIYHGVKGKTTPTRIRLRARRDDDVLSLTVEDDGLGMSAQALEKVRARLRKAHDADFILSQYAYQKTVQLSKRAGQLKRRRRRMR